MKFGTSGLRGPAEGFTPELTAAYVEAFLDTAAAGARARQLAIGMDRRASSPAIAAAVAAAARGAGWEPLFCGALPTPALAGFAMARAIPAIMVTGSHIPADQNGLKFYRPDGELRKSDEQPILDAVAGRPSATPAGFALPEPDPAARLAYRQRLLSAFAPGALEGLRLGVYAHSAVGWRDMEELLSALGASCTVLEPSADFIAVDTEAVDPAALARLRALGREHGFDAIVSTDGDGDRPLLLDAEGVQVNGDVLGALAALALGADSVVTPLTSTSAIEASGWFAHLARTRIGSPFVIEAMETAPGTAIVGFEANGGFLVQTTLDNGGRPISPLPTRDALLPLITVLAEARREGVAVRALADRLPPRAMLADRLPQVAPDRGHGLVAELARSDAARRALDPHLAHPAAIDTTDGTRMVRADGVIVHVRQSGNAPELRCYVEAPSPEAARAVLEAMMARLAARLGG
ncbi:phosphomannomutase [Pelagibacterium lacus]|uniref:Phosphomannomutase n=1 Tax=Pelagibacterium lacus TaxID=2282655 RepID=A0A369W160_9HYPH|nr:phosphomannomutase [Pelagibacterium lacus]